MVSKSALHTVRSNWHNRHLVLDLVRRDFRVRYLGSVLGGYWNLIHPIAMIAIYTIIFSQVMRARIGEGFGKYAFTIYLCAGMIPWTAFQELVSRGTNVFHENSNLIKKVSFPKEILYSVVGGSSLITFMITLGLYIPLLLILGHGLSSAIILLPMIILLQMIFAIGLSTLLSVLNVFFRDIQQFVTITFQVWFWATPIVYMPKFLPEGFRQIIALNPFYYFVRMYQDIFFFKVWPQITHMMIATAVSLGTYFLANLLFQSTKDEIADEL